MPWRIQWCDVFIEGSSVRDFKTDYVLFGLVERLMFILLGLIVPISSASTLCFVVAGGFGVVSSCQIAVALWRADTKFSR